MARVLIADDDQAHGQVLAIVVSSERHHCLSYHDGQSVLNYLATQEVDLLILDVFMPRVGGLEICRRLRRLERFDATPIIMTSAYHEITREIVLEAGANHYLSKPVLLSELKHCISILLEQRPHNTASRFKRWMNYSRL